MSYVFNFLVCLAGILLQTALLPGWAPLGRAYDLQVPFVIFLGLYRPIQESLICLLLAGTLMDGLSGGAFGLHVTAYLWIYLGTIWTVRYLHLVNSILLPFVVAGGVLFENLVFLAGAALAPGALDIGAAVLGTVAVQFLLALVTGPFVLLFFQASHTGWQRWTARHLTRRNGIASP